MNKLLQEVNNLKVKAKNRRDLGRYEVALKLLKKAVEQLEDELYSSRDSILTKQVASELSDFYGLIGGVCRRQALEEYDNNNKRSIFLLNSITAYDEGYHIECNKNYGIIASYNLLNRLISRILYSPDSLENPEMLSHCKGIEYLNIRKELSNAERIIATQLKVERRGDIWALSDLCLVKLLLDRPECFSTYSDFFSELPPDYVYESTFATLKPLSELKLPMNDKILEVLDRLKMNWEQVR